MQNSGFPTYNNIFHVSFSDFDVQKWRTLVLCCKSDKNCSFLRQFRALLASKLINIFNFLRNFLDATFRRRIGDDDDHDDDDDDDELYSCVDVLS